MSPLPALLVLLLASLLPAPSSQLQCERKTIGREDVDHASNIGIGLGPIDCLRGPGWTGRLEYTLNNPGFTDPMSTYKIWWRKSVKRPNCMIQNKMSLHVNGREDRDAVIQSDHVSFKVPKPICEQTSFTIKFFIYFKGLRLEDKCFEIETDQIFPEMPEMRDFLHLNQMPVKSANAENNQVKIFWRRYMFKLGRFQNCVNMKLNSKMYKPNTSIGRYNQFVTIAGKCNAYNVNLVYIFNHNKKHSTYLNIPAFQSMCGKRPNPENHITQNNDHVEFPETTTIPSITNSFKTTENALNNFFVENNYMVTKIVAGSFGCVLLLVLIPIMIIVLVKKKRKRREAKMEERKDHNPIYGTYYDGPTYITATDNNELYDS